MDDNDFQYTFSKTSVKHCFKQSVIITTRERSFEGK